MNAIELFEQAEAAWDAENYDEAIRKFDQCLCSNPSPPVAMKAYVNIGVMIHTKFRFGFRRGESVSDEEARWVMRVGICGQKAVEVYKNQISNTPYEGELYELFKQAKSIHQFGTTYCLAKRDAYGKLDFRDFAARNKINLPPIRSIADEENRQLESLQRSNEGKRQSSFSEGKQQNSFSEAKQQSSFSEPTSSVSTNNGISILAAVATFVLSYLFMAAVGSGFLGYCCFPIILAVVAYFVTPTVIKSMPMVKESTPMVIEFLKGFDWRSGMNDSQPLSLLSPSETEVQGLPDIKPYDAPAKFSFTLPNLIQLDETSVESTISYLLSTNPEYKIEREQAKKEASRHLKTIFATRIWSPYEIKSFYWFSADKTDTHLKLSFDLYTIPAPVHMNYMVGRVHFETPLNAPDGQIEKTWISIVSEEEIQENIEMLKEE